MQIVKAPDKRLRTKTKRVNKITPELIKLTQEMIEFASSFKDPEGVGLSTNQIGRTERFFVAK
ncbi:MAG: peptide deformylase, partial [Candidatus Daviesbacteria bacterium]|nr:peptide deformylase [Candidatus Daviesbacteria bacterium]